MTDLRDAVPSLRSASMVESLLYGVTGRDPLALAEAAVTLLVTSGVAGWIPARHACRADPMIVLRHQ